METTTVVHESIIGAKTGKRAILLGEAHFNGRGQESDPVTMDYAVMTGDHGVCFCVASYQNTGYV